MADYPFAEKILPNFSDFPADRSKIIVPPRKTGLLTASETAAMK
jgi:hypothetical protein